MITRSGVTATNLTLPCPDTSVTGMSRDIGDS
jgi:hypothetical protein